MIKISPGGEIDARVIANYFDGLVGCFFKILPMREQKEKTLGIYLKNLQEEITSCGKIVEMINYDSRWLSLLSTLQFLIDNPDCPVKDVKRKVFGAISTCNKLKEQYSESEAQ